MSDFYLNEFVSSNLSLISAVAAIAVSLLVVLLWHRRPTPSKSNYEAELLLEEASARKKSKLETSAKKKKQKKPVVKLTANGQAVPGAEVAADTKQTKDVKLTKPEQVKQLEKSKIVKPTSPSKRSVKSDLQETMLDDWTVNMGKKKQKGGKKEGSVPPPTPYLIDEVTPVETKSISVISNDLESRSAMYDTMLKSDLDIESEDVKDLEILHDVGGNESLLPVDTVLVRKMTVEMKNVDFELTDDAASPENSSAAKGSTDGNLNQAELSKSRSSKKKKVPTATLR